jgi:hypothetical protein
MTSIYFDTQKRDKENSIKVACFVINAITVFFSFMLITALLFNAGITGLLLNYLTLNTPLKLVLQLLTVVAYPLIIGYASMALSFWFYYGIYRLSNKQRFLIFMFKFYSRKTVRNKFSLVGLLFILVPVIVLLYRHIIT